MSVAKTLGVSLVPRFSLVTAGDVIVASSIPLMAPIYIYYDRTPTQSKNLFQF